MCEDIDAVYRGSVKCPTVLDVPPVELRRKRILETVDIHFDALSMHALLRRPHRLLVAQRGKVSEVPVLLRERKGVIQVTILACAKMTAR